MMDKQIEDVQIVEETSTKIANPDLGVSEVIPTEVINQEDEKAEMEKALEMQKFELFFKSQLKNRLVDIKNYIRQNKITVDEAIQEVHDKKSRLSASNRDVLESVKPEYLNKWLNE